MPPNGGLAALAPNSVTCGDKGRLPEPLRNEQPATVTGQGFLMSCRAVLVLLVRARGAVERCKFGRALGDNCPLSGSSPLRAAGGLECRPACERVHSWGALALHLLWWQRGLATLS